MDSEKLLERNMRDDIKNLGGLALKFHCLSFSGFPDRIVLAPRGRIYFIELKSEGKRPSKIQNVVHIRLAALGFKVFVIDTKESLKLFIDLVKSC